MASGRRGGPPDLKSTLGSLLRTTLEHASAVKDVFEHQARGRGGMVDQALLQRRRKEALTRLGESVFRLSQRGELGELALDPEIGMALADVEAAEGEGATDEMHLESIARRSGAEAVSSANYRPARASSEDRGEYRVWRPVMPAESEAASAESEADNHVGADAPKHGIASHDQEQAPEQTEQEQGKLQARVPVHMARRSAQRGKGGGIQFVAEQPRAGDEDSDDDLEAYMHEGDVPQ